MMLLILFPLRWIPYKPYNFRQLYNQFYLNNKDEVNCSFTLEEDGTVFDFSFSHEEYPLPVAESTLFGWSVKFWDFHQQQWMTLPDYFETDQAAYDQAELIMKSIDEGSKND